MYVSTYVNVVFFYSDHMASTLLIFSELIGQDASPVWMGATPFRSPHTNSVIPRCNSLKHPLLVSKLASSCLDAPLRILSHQCIVCIIWMSVYACLCMHAIQHLLSCLLRTFQPHSSAVYISNLVRWQHLSCRYFDVALDAVLCSLRSTVGAELEDAILVDLLPK